METFKFIGVAGIILISIGMITKKRTHKTYIYYILGGLCLETYSIFIGDIVFMVLQAIFIFTATFKLYKSYD